MTKIVCVFLFYEDRRSAGGIVRQGWRSLCKSSSPRQTPACLWQQHLRSPWRAAHSLKKLVRFSPWCRGKGKGINSPPVPSSVPQAGEMLSHTQRSLLRLVCPEQEPHHLASLLSTFSVLSASPKCTQLFHKPAKVTRSMEQACNLLISWLDMHTNLSAIKMNSAVGLWMASP